MSEERKKKATTERPSCRLTGGQFLHAEPYSWGKLHDAESE